MIIPLIYELVSYVSMLVLELDIHPDQNKGKTRAHCTCLKTHPNKKDPDYTT